MFNVKLFNVIHFQSILKQFISRTISICVTWKLKKFADKIQMVIGTSTQMVRRSAEQRLNTAQLMLETRRLFVLQIVHMTHTLMTLPTNRLTQKTDAQNVRVDADILITSSSNGGRRTNDSFRPIIII